MANVNGTLVLSKFSEGVTPNKKGTGFVLRASIETGSGEAYRGNRNLSREQQQAYASWQNIHIHSRNEADLQAIVDGLSTGEQKGVLVKGSGDLFEGVYMNEETGEVIRSARPNLSAFVTNLQFYNRNVKAWAPIQFAFK